MLEVLVLLFMVTAVMVVCAWALVDSVVATRLEFERGLVLSMGGDPWGDDPWGDDPWGDDPWGDDPWGGDDDA